MKQDTKFRKSNPVVLIYSSCIGTFPLELVRLSRPNQQDCFTTMFCKHSSKISPTCHATSTINMAARRCLYTVLSERLKNRLQWLVLRRAMINRRWRDPNDENDGRSAIISGIVQPERKTWKLCMPARPSDDIFVDVINYRKCGRANEVAWPNNASSPRRRSVYLFSSNILVQG